MEFKETASGKYHNTDENRSRYCIHTNFLEQESIS